MDRRLTNTEESIGGGPGKATHGVATVGANLPFIMSLRVKTEFIFTRLILWSWMTLSAVDAAGSVGKPGLLHSNAYRNYVEAFNANDSEANELTFSNVQAWQFLEVNIPLFDCPDKVLEEIYYFRWWTFRKHIKNTDDGYVITEFLPPVKWAGRNNTISCAAAHHYREGRWLRNSRYLDDYSRFWLKKGGALRKYSFWVADSIWNQYLVTGNRADLESLLPALVANYHEWGKSHQVKSGLFWQNPSADGMEVAASGNARFRPTINSYMFGESYAIAEIAALVGKAEIAATFGQEARHIKELVQRRLWDTSAEFFKSCHGRVDAETFSDVRELHGFTPWYFNLPDPGFEAAWKQVIDPRGFAAPYGLTTVEQRSPRFKLDYEGHECQWNGPSWPYATSITLTAMANLLNVYDQSVIDRRNYLDALHTYAQAQHLVKSDGRQVPWIDENLNPYTGDWIARSRILAWERSDPKKWQNKGGTSERGKDYNHSTFCDLIISGLVGIRPRQDNMIEINPLVPPDAWDYFCLDGVRYHGHDITVVYDKTGKRYGIGSGLRVIVDGVTVATFPEIGRLIGALP